MKIIILKYINRFKRLLRYNEVIPQPGHITPEYNIPEILPINCRESEIKETRLNLLVPALSLRFSFGGINTALEFFISLIEGVNDARIIVTDEAESDLKGLPQADCWKLLNAEQVDEPGKTIICFGDRYNKTIPIRKNDVFVATAWWTAYNGEKILTWQKEKWKTKPSSMVYLIQDFEPGFYKWSSRYLLALSTYQQKNMIAIVNTTLLFDYIKLNGINFKHYYIFEPTINRKLLAALQEKRPFSKKKKIIFYGRPSVERNAYEVIVKGLEFWSFWYPHAKDWEIVSLGESYSGARLGNDITITVKGKISLEEYANTLLESAVGISLMISPHPSYPPLEMAAFGLAVITNKFFNKNLSEFHENLFSLDDINPETIAILLADLCKKFEEKENYFANKNFRNMDFLGSTDAFGFIDDLKCHLLQKEHSLNEI